MKIHIKLRNGSSSEILIKEEHLSLLIDNIPMSMENVKEILIKPTDNNDERPLSELEEVEKMSKEELQKEYNKLIRDNDIRFDKYGTIIGDNVTEDIADRFELIRDELETRDRNKK